MTQITTAMANTWLGVSAPSLPGNFNEQKREGPDPAFEYQVRRLAGRFEFSVAAPDRAKTALPVEALVGGKRHGISFLMRIRDIDGIPLQRPALIEARYAYSPHGLVLSPGFDKEKPATFEGSLGRVLSPSFEQRCLTCHGQPGTLGAGQHGGVRCESCHGPAAVHVNSMKSAASGPPVRPEALTGNKATAVCAQCHSGLSSVTHADPMPGDLLVSSQVPALRNSECFKQTGGAVNCTDCHDPHKDSAQIAQTSVKTCLRCHSLAASTHASICPINATFDCVKCHMPSIESNSFHLTDHWIAVHPEQGVTAAKRDDRLRSLVVPRSEYLEIIATEDRGKAEAARQRLDKGDSFYDVAHDMSIDPTAPGGGFVGELQLADMDPALAAAAAPLAYGETSGIIEQRQRCVILHRLPRDFKWQANQLFEEAGKLRAQTKDADAMKKAEEALKVYPYFLRALVFMGTMFGEAGNGARASEVLAFAAQSYPQDASAEFDFGLTLGKDPANQISAFRRAIERDPELVAAYESLGVTLASTGQVTQAMDIFRQGLEINPLSAILNYDLGLALKQQGQEVAAKQAFALAAKLDPEIAARLSKSQ